MTKHVSLDPLMTKLALLATRAVVAAVFLWHGIPKAFVPSIGMAKFTGWDLPAVLGPVVGVAEVLAAVLLVLGLFTRAAAIALAVIIVGAIVTVQLPAGITAGLERDLLILVALFVLLSCGPGTVSVDARRGE
jgi:putative oxidoreductase